MNTSPIQWLQSLVPRMRSWTQDSIGRGLPTQDLALHQELAVAWLVRAQSVGKDGGVPAFYDVLRDSWAPSYPETTGYIIPTLLACAKWYSDADMRNAALRMADYLLRVQTAEGAIPGWSAGAPVYVFDTGQVLFGWLAAFRETGDETYRAALQRAANWLVDHQEPEGCWTMYQFGGHSKIWDVRVGWALLLVGQELRQPASLEAGQRCLEWALTHQDTDGWLRCSSLEVAEPPVTHTIAYAVEGFLESGILLEEDRYIRAARRTADALLVRQRLDGSLPGYWAAGWQPLTSSVCLTGNAQMALCWLRLYQYTGEARYMEAGEKALAFVTSVQHLSNHWPPIYGAIAGSWPIWGKYLRWRYPNWAVKFFLDALMLRQRLVR